jgi:hypothetical protein
MEGGMALQRARFLLVSLATLGLAFSAYGATQDTKKTDAAKFVSDAAQAEIRGDGALSSALLKQALQVDPDNRAARWQLGQVLIDKEWVPVNVAQRRASGDARQAEYRKLRTALGESPQGQLALARWCQKNNLRDEARFHWSSVLGVDPRNEEALRALDLKWQNGRLMSPEQMAQNKERMRDAKRAADRYAPKLIRWRRAVAGRDPDARDAALTEIRQIDQSDAIPSLEEITLGRDARNARHADECRQICLAFLEALEQIPGLASTASLARHAVYSPSDEARKSAIEKLKTRDKHEYVPMLLSGLGMPIESSFSINTGSDGSVFYTHTLFREGQDSDWSFDARNSTVMNDLGGRRQILQMPSGVVEEGPPSSAYPAEIAKKARVTSRNQNRYSLSAAATESKVAGTNQAIDALNALIIPVLEITTEQKLGDNPKAWWNWWRDQNEYYESGDHPVDQHYAYNTNTYNYGYPTSEVRYPPQVDGTSRRHSCFAKGTMVWTKTGRRPIESIELGDLVLAQDVDTGELKYEPVIGRTVRPPSPIIKLTVDKEQIRVTLGHLFWVSGVGWRMAKELEDGALLHGVSGASAIRAKESDGEAEAYNLVVADLGTYFVGEHGFLVHDNTPRSSTQAIVPGVLAAK